MHSRERYFKFRCDEIDDYAVMTKLFFNLVSTVAEGASLNITKRSLFWNHTLKIVPGGYTG